MKTLRLLISRLFRYKYFIISIFLFFNVQGEIYGQQKIETKKSLNDKEINNFITEASVDEVGKFIYNTSLENPKKLIDYNSLFLQRGKRTNNDTIRYLSYYCFSEYYHYEQADFFKATAYADSTLVVAKNIDILSKITRALNLKGNLEIQYGDYENAFKSYKDAYDLSKKNKLYEEELVSMGHLGHIKKELEEYEEAIEIYNQLFSLLKTEQYHTIDSYNRIYINGINVLAICHREIGQTKKSIELFKEGISFIENLDNQSFNVKRARLLSNMSKSCINQGDYDTALHHLNLSKDVFLKENKFSDHTYFYMCFFMAKALEGKQNYKEALIVLEEALANSEGKIYLNIFIDISDLAAEMGTKLNDKEKQLEYSLLRNKITDSIHKRNVSTRKLINKDLSEKNEALNLNNETISEKLGQTKIIIFILLLSLLITVSVYWNNNSKNRKKFKKLLNRIEKIETEKIISPTIVSDEKVNTILIQLEKLEKKAFFLRKDCSLHNTAAKLKTNTSYLSKIINSYKQKTFKEYINELRIEFVLKEIKENPRFRLYTIKAIAEETGYKSVNTLNQTFKKHTQLNLSYYIKQFNKES
ncbi:AraC family transcriptional regulator [uncultured Lacinutrix sp.]|uniref:AraC family transcriptional regulator n=1 Tax=uncultured Lacinutrix sp. TaxID=574032 RepID=UPI00260BE04E|nr:AraC family transcriptional regulator [uncultured Lacinutrix sp.]